MRLDCLLARIVGFLLAVEAVLGVNKYTEFERAMLVIGAVVILLLTDITEELSGECRE